MKKGSFLVGLALVMVVATASHAVPQFMIVLSNDYGQFESQAIASLDPPGYPDGQGNEPYGWGDEPYESHIAFDINGKKYGWLTHSAPTIGQTWTSLGFIWSGTTNVQQAINVYWQMEWLPTTYSWRLVVFNHDGTVAQDISAVPQESYSFLNGTFTLPILRSDDWRHGYPFRLAVNTPIPEPGSLLALGSGLVGLIGFGIRRRP